MESAVKSAAPPKPGILNRIFRNVFRIFFLTLLLTGLGMALGLFTGILTTVIAAAFAHHALDLTRAYRIFAIPSAIIFGSCTFVFEVVQTARRGLR